MDEKVIRAKAVRLYHDLKYRLGKRNIAIAFNKDEFVAFLGVLTPFHAIMDIYIARGSDRAYAPYMKLGDGVTGEYLHHWSVDCILPISYTGKLFDYSAIECEKAGEISYYRDAVEAGRALSIAPSRIRDVCEGVISRHAASGDYYLITTADGYTFKYITLQRHTHRPDRRAVSFGP